MKLVDDQGKEITSKENQEASELEQQLAGKTEKLIEPILNRVKLSGAQLGQEQLMQLSSMAHQILFNRLVFNLIKKVGVDNIDDLISEDDIEELQTAMNNQLQMVDPNKQGGGSGGQGSSEHPEA